MYINESCVVDCCLSLPKSTILKATLLTTEVGLGFYVIRRFECTHLRFRLTRTGRQAFQALDLETVAVIPLNQRIGGILVGYP